MKLDFFLNEKKKIKLEIKFMMFDVIKSKTKYFFNKMAKQTSFKREVLNNFPLKLYVH